MTKKKKSKPEEPTTWLTLGEFAAMIGITMEKPKTKKPIKP